MTTVSTDEHPPAPPGEQPPYGGGWLSADGKGPGRGWSDLVGEIVGGSGTGAQLARYVGLVLAFFVAEHFVFHSSPAEIINGLSVGALYGLVGVGIVLIYRTARIINFAAAAIGAVPAIAALLLDVENGVSYLAVLPLALLGAPLIGALTDIFVIRRFQRSPRLILTVVTIGVAQSLAALGFFIPVWMGARAGEIPNVPTPFDSFQLHNGRGEPVLTGNQVWAFGVTVGVSILLALFLRYTRMGIALRASSENADRAALLGIPVKRVQTAAWMIAGALGGLAIFVQAPLIGVPNDATLGFSTLLYGLAAAVIGRMQRIGMTLGAGLAIGVIVSASVTHYGDNSVAAALMLPIILVALLLQRGQSSRAEDSGVSTWQAVREFRPIPLELRGLREVNIARAMVYVAVIGVAVVLPFAVGGPNLPALILLPIYGIVAVSLVILTGWAGQISLGQFGFVAIGAEVAGGLIANHNIDFFVALLIGIGAGVVASVVIGFPAVRIQGLNLAVTTLAFGYAMADYALNSHYALGKWLLPSGLTAHLARPMIYGRIDLENDRTFYFLCVILLALCITSAVAFRRLRSGRVLIAVRDNQRAAPSYGVNLTRTKLAAFAASGAMAGLAGVLLAYSEHNVIQGSFDPSYSIGVFLAAVIGGLSSVPWAVSAAVIFEAFQVFLPKLNQFWGPTVTAVVPLLFTGPLLVLNLYQYPGGSAEWGFGLRDQFLRRLARKYDVLVPSLVADRRVETGEEAVDVIQQAEKSVEATESFDVVAAEGTITCPVCGEVLTVAAAVDHEHLRGGPGAEGGGGARMPAARRSRP
ncbi:MAG TPA: ABC transporter permease [Acidimicrobiales bacterium]|nr:ABC transporter permease [Acidimicrobiales bacterium]